MTTKTPMDLAREVGAIFTESVDLVCFPYPLIDTFAIKIIEQDRAQRQAEPYAYAVYFPDQPTEELVHDLDALADDLTNRHHTITSLYTAPPPAQVPEGWIEIKMPKDGQAIEGKSSEDGPVWIEDWDKDEPLGSMRFWRPAPR